MHIAGLGTLLLLWVALGLPVAGAAKPVDLKEQRARPVRVALEISPDHLPARLDHQYSDLGPAWFEPGPGAGKVTIRVAGPDLERMLVRQDPVPGSFDDYLWIFEAETGHVLQATVSGAFYRHVEMGFLQTRLSARIAAQMTTLRSAGFLAPRAQWGHVLFEHCLGGDHGCNVVPPRPYDPKTGYVNAVGAIRATAVGGFGTVTFSPLGEAVFTEMRADTAVSAR